MPVEPEALAAGLAAELEQAARASAAAVATAIPPILDFLCTVTVGPFDGQPGAGFGKLATDKRGRQ